jgi:hypothetical protein
MPPNHRAVHQQRQFDGNRYRSWAKTIGDNTYFIIDCLLSSGKVEEQGYKSCMGILQFSKTYSGTRLEMACKRARELGSHTYSTVKKSSKTVRKASCPAQGRQPLNMKISAAAGITTKEADYDAYTPNHGKTARHEA